ncbi:MAG: ABC transporter ATP-binding protein [Pseudomonadota bacterium]|nr:ABC transporter ATP-binding protein [Rubrivivax sp.]
MLELAELSCGYGEVVAVQRLTLRLEPGRMLALIGPNGAGKSSTLAAVAGHVKLFGGALRYEGESLERLTPGERAARGIAWVPEGRRLFGDLTVRENLTVGGYVRPRRAEAANLERVVTLFPRVGERLRQLAGSLSGGEQQMVAIGRALMAEPRLLMIDELSLGLMPKAVMQIYAALARLRAEGLAILLVEQNTRHALGAADSAVIVESGRDVWSGSAAEAAADPALLRHYLGSA